MKSIFHHRPQFLFYLRNCFLIYSLFNVLLFHLTILVPLTLLPKLNLTALTFLNGISLLNQRGCEVKFDVFNLGQIQKILYMIFDSLQRMSLLCWN